MARCTLAVALLLLPPPVALSIAAYKDRLGRQSTDVSGDIPKLGSWERSALPVDSWSAVPHHLTQLLMLAACHPLSSRTLGPSRSPAAGAVNNWELQGFANLVKASHAHTITLTS